MPLARRSSSSCAPTAVSASIWSTCRRCRRRSAHRPTRSSACRRATPERRLCRESRPAIGKLLRGQALGLDPQDASAASSSSSANSARCALSMCERPRRDRAHARHADQPEITRVRPHGRRGYLRPPGLSRILPRLVTDLNLRTLAHLSRLDVGRYGGGQPRAALSRLATISSCRVITTASSHALVPAARICMSCFAMRSRAACAVRLHHRRRALQARLVRPRAAALRSSRRRHVAGPNGRAMIAATGEPSVSSSRRPSCGSRISSCACFAALSAAAMRERRGRSPRCKLPGNCTVKLAKVGRWTGGASGYRIKAP